MPTVSLRVNGEAFRVEADPSTPLLWVLRDVLGLTGTKFGCGVGQCGACTVHLDAIAIRACSVPLSEVAGRSVVTIEGLAPRGELHPLQRAWIEHDVPQCGFCQPGQIMNAAALLRRSPRPDDDAIDRAMRGNICRCGTYSRIRRAIRSCRAPAPPRAVPDASVDGGDG